MLGSSLGASPASASTPHRTNTRAIAYSNAQNAAVHTSLVVPPVLAALTQSPLIKSADTARVAGGTASKATALKIPPPGIAVGTAAIAKASSAPVAFTLRLTPEQAPETPRPADPGSNADSTVIKEVPAAVPDSVALPQAQPGQKPAEPEPKPTAGPVESKSRAESHEDPAPAVTAIAGINPSEDENFARQMPNLAATPAPAPVLGKAAAATPVASASEALRTSEPTASASPTQPASSIREIAVRVSAPQSPAVDVQLTERAGQVHVAVRTPDGGLQASLRQDLGSLVNSLERSGFRAEAFAPREATLQANSAAQENAQNSRQEAESGSGGRGASQDSWQNSGGGQQQRQRDSRPQQFIEELENQA